MEIMLLPSLAKLEASLSYTVGNMKRAVVGSICHIDLVLILVLPLASCIKWDDSNVLCCLHEDIRK